MGRPLKLAEFAAGKTCAVCELPPEIRGQITAVRADRRGIGTATIHQWLVGEGFDIPPGDLKNHLYNPSGHHG